MSECQIKLEIRQMINGCSITDEKAACSIARIMKMRHRELDKHYVANLTKNIIKEKN
ncbi:MAG: hypothetical protein L0Y61_04335 [Epsilonproteobacteria bacterium]|nr:hypothetical protein [Campylobacterota bacterium]